MLEPGKTQNAAPVSAPLAKDNANHREFPIAPSQKPALTGPLEQSNPLLKAVGVPLGAQGFNMKVQQVSDAYRSAYGTLPPPGLTLDVIKSGVDPAHYGLLFSVPRDPRVAQAQGSLYAQGIDPNASGHELAQHDPRNQLIQALNGAKTRDNFNAVVDDNSDLLHSLIDNGDKAVLRAYTQAQSRGFQAQVDTTMRGAKKVESFVPAPGTLLGKLERVSGDAIRATSQIETGLILGPPLLGVAEGKAVAKSVKEKSLHPFAATNFHLAKQVGEGFKQDVTHPEQNAGNLLLDVYGLASLGVGTGARLAAAGKALARDEGAVAVGRALLTKTATGTYHLGADADVPLSSNPLAAQIQKLVYNHRLQGVSADESTGAMPIGASASLVGEKASELADRIADPLRQNFSMENKIGRQLRASDRVERSVRMSLLDPLVKATGSANNTSLVIRRLGAKGWRGLSVGEQKAIQVLTTDDPTPLETWKQFHESMIQQGVGDAAAHRAHLAALEQASKVIAKPSPKFLSALADVQEVMDEQQLLRIEKMGLAPETAEGRIASLGQVVRGETRDASKNAVVPAMTGSDDVLRMTAQGRSPDYIAKQLASRRTVDVGAEQPLPILDAIKHLDGEVAKLKASLPGKALTPTERLVRRGEEMRNPGAAEAHAAGVSEQVARLTKQADELRASYDKTLTSELRNVHAKIASPEAKEALTPKQVRSTPKNPDARYLLYQSLGKKRRAPKTFFAPRPGAYGIARPGGLPETSHYFTGDAIRAGDFRIDATRIASETYARTVSAAMKLDAWKRLHDFYATDAPRTADDIPIRDSSALDENLRALVNKVDNGQVISAEDLQGLSPQLVEDLTRYLIPHPDDVKAGEGKWKYVDQRYLASEARSSVPTPAVRAFSNLNEPLRDATLFLRPGYALNLLNNAEMLAIDQGFYAIPNMLRALRADAKTGRFIDALAGEGRVLSYAPNVGLATRLSHALASRWNRLTDLYFRRAAVIFYLRKAGYRTEEQINTLRDAYLRGDEDARKVTTEASQRAKKAMVELDNLTPFERNVLRHVIFVYPWVSRSAVWSLKTIVDHPAQAAILAEVAKSEKQELDPVLQRLPSWMQDLGYVPIGWNADGSPRVINPGSINTFSTLGEVAGVARGDQVFTDLLGPGADLIVRLATERDRFGKAYQHPYLDPIIETASGLPQLATLKRAGQKEPAEKPLDMSNPNALVEREHADIHRPIFVPGDFWNTYGPLILSGLDPRTVDPRAVDARYWQGQPWEKRHEHEAQLIQKMATEQGKFIGRNVPQEIRDALTLTSARTDAYHQFSQDKGRTPTAVERTQLDISTLEQAGKITSKQASTLRTNLAKVAPDELDTFRTGLLDKFAGGKELSDWHRQVALVATTANRQDLDANIQKLVAAGVLPKHMGSTANASDEQLREYGRRLLAYDTKVREFAKQEKQARTKGQDTATIAAQLRAFQDEQDRTVVVDGHVFPSLPRMMVAQLTHDQLVAHLADNMRASWGDLSALDKELAGRPTTPQVSEAWAAFKNATSPQEIAKHLPPGKRSLDSKQRLTIAKEIDDYYGLKGSFVRDYAFAQLPLYQRVQKLKIVTESPDKRDWSALLSVAGKLDKDAKAGTVSREGADQLWHDYAEHLRTWLPENRPAFWRELQPYLHEDPNFLDHLLTR